MMIVVFEGLPASGKSFLTHEVAKVLRCDYLPEIVLPFPPVRDNHFYVQNDITKYSQAITKDLVICDRDYVSTLAYNFASDALHKEHCYPSLQDQITILQQDHQLGVADVYFFLALSPSGSLQRQSSKHYGNLWQDINFLELQARFYRDYFEDLSKHTIVCMLDAQLERNDLLSRIITFLQPWIQK